MSSSTHSGVLCVALGLCLAIPLSSLACAWLVPPSWRSEFDIGLFGPIDGKKRAPESERAESTAPLDPEERRMQARLVAEAVERDRRDLLDLIADPEASLRSPAEDRELRRIVERLPELQDELQSLERSLAADDESGG